MINNSIWRFAPRTSYSEVRVPINIAPEVRERLRGLLMQPELQGVGYSACELAEGDLMNSRSGIIA
jgi:hypothetical protein